MRAEDVVKPNKSLENGALIRDDAYSGSNISAVIVYSYGSLRNKITSVGALSKELEETTQPD